MPTGYTSDIKQGITFERYAMGCARAFGALIDMRDDPSDAPIPAELAPSNYHEQKMFEAKRDLDMLNQLSIEDANSSAVEEWNEAEKRRIEYLAENELQLEKYNEMLEHVNAWTAPTKDHKGLHDFMREQIESSIKYDCGGDYYARPAEKITGEQWLEQKKEKAKHDIEYHDAENKKEIQRTNERNSWLKSLRESLTK